ncbi:alpha-amylase family glycosyl hydrolase, partial [Treponema socranskii]|uniref:alpha-amylase family glycosyl hydrolase n=1 Tax=Treponema socranskii TaxID=53419 RepID=UPI0036207835
MKRVLLLPLALCGMLPFLSCSSSPKSAVHARRASEKSSPIVRLADKPSEGVYYSLFVRSFADSNGDGIGDFAGIIKKLDYLNDGDDATTDDLGITGIWLLPIYPSQSY